jgi:hypothetical protein
VSDAPDYEHVFTLVAAMSDAPDWQETAVGPGGTPIASGFQAVTGISTSEVTVGPGGAESGFTVVECPYSGTVAVWLLVPISTTGDNEVVNGSIWLTLTGPGTGPSDTQISSFNLTVPTNTAYQPNLVPVFGVIYNAVATDTVIGVTVVNYSASATVIFGGPNEITYGGATQYMLMGS